MSDLGPTQIMREFVAEFDAIATAIDPHPYSRLRPPMSDDEIAAIRALVAPMCIADEVVNFWSVTGGGWVTRMLAGPAIGLHGPKEEIELFWDLGHPRALLPLGFESQTFLCSEMSFEPTAASAIWSVGNVAAGLFPVALSLTHLLTHVTEVLVRERREPEWNEFVPLVPGTQVLLDHDVPEGWPAAWQRAQGFSADAIAPLGATTCLRDIVRGVAPARWIVVVDARHLGSSAGRSVVQLDDGTGCMDVIVPSEADPWHLIGRHRVEVELVPVGDPDELQRTAREIDDAVHASADAIGVSIPDDLLRHLGSEAACVAVSVRLARRLD
jgi:hypothetical protein